MAENDEYPPWVGLVYVFNLIVGTGALTLPAAFQGAGWLFSTIALMTLCFVSFITVTFVIESMACANAILHWNKIQEHKTIEESEAPLNLSDDSEADVTTESTAILANRSRRHFNLNRKVELAEIASLFLPKSGHFLFFFFLSIYLFGDLTIYVAASGKTLVNLSCQFSNNSEDFTKVCWEGNDLTRTSLYRIYVILFGFLVGPFTYFNLQKTKYLQFFTIAIRWLAFSIMLTLAIIRLLKYGPEGFPDLVNLAEIPALAGSSVYSFMCHHSLPGLIAPISNKTGLFKKISMDFVVICSFYLLLSLTGSFAFKIIDDLYSLNFIAENDSGTFMKFIGTFLAAFPLFPMSTSFPIIAITMQSNLKNLFIDPITYNRHNFVVRRLLFPSLALFPPLLTALTTHNVKTLVEITGSYMGVVVQYVIPAILVINARRRCQKRFGSNLHTFASPFRQYRWFLFILGWSGVCVAFVTVDLIINH